MAREDDDFFLARWSRRKALVQRGVAVEPEPPAAPDGAAAVATAPSAVAVVPAEAPAADPAPAVAPAPSRPATPPPPTLEDVAKLTRDADFSRFVARDVEAPVRHAALRKLFSDPHFNVMDGLDIYIDDYGRPDPLPASMLRQMVQARGLGLFRDETPAAPAGAAAGGGAAPSDADPASALAHDGEPDPARNAGPTAERPALADVPAGQPHTADAAAPPLPPDEDPDLQLQPNDAAGPAGDRRRAGEDPRRLD